MYNNENKLSVKKCNQLKEIVYTAYFINAQNKHKARFNLKSQTQHVIIFKCISYFESAPFNLKLFDSIAHNEAINCKSSVF